MEKKKITVKELAQKLGVSISTVSKALNDSYEISEKTKKKVRRLAEKYNYKPNRLAVNLKSGNTRTIGVILPSILSNFFTTVLYGIEQVTNEAGYSIIACFSNESFDREVTYVDILSNGAIDGLIVAIAEETQIKKDYSHFENCIEEGNPVVMFDRVTKAVECDKVVVDDFNDARMATQHLLDCGCQSVALVSSIDFLSVGKDRVKGFVSKLEEVQGQVKQDRIIRCSVEDLDKCVDRILANDSVDGFFAVDEDASLAICKVAKNRGIRIPDDLSVIGYAGEKLATNVAPGLTTVNQNGVSIGREAARIMLERIENGKGPFAKKVIETTIEMRASTRAL